MKWSAVIPTFIIPGGAGRGLEGPGCLPAAGIAATCGESCSVQCHAYQSGLCKAWVGGDTGFKIILLPGHDHLLLDTIVLWHV